MANIQTESTLTDRYQTTIPEPVRKALNLSKRDKIVYRETDEGVVTITKAESAADELDPVALAFLSFLEARMLAEPSALTSIELARLERLRELTSGVLADLDAPLDPADD
ncbi:MAG: hypothetical protein RLZZ443_194 [Actinomycetota bacterium]|jgi:antitoxin PrlF